MTTQEDLNIKVGDIYYDSWGYSMTIVDFYRVVRLTPKKAVVVSLKGNATPDGYLAGHTVPTDEAYGEESMLKIKGDNLTGSVNNGCQILKGHSLWKWDGRPVYFNHCD